MGRNRNNFNKTAVTLSGSQFVSRKANVTASSGRQTNLAMQLPTGSQDLVTDECGAWQL